jgi:hypothetical protein
MEALFLGRAGSVDAAIGLSTGCPDPWRAGRLLLEQLSPDSREIADSMYAVGLKVWRELQRIPPKVGPIGAASRVFNAHSFLQSSFRQLLIGEPCGGKFFWADMAALDTPIVIETLDHVLVSFASTPVVPSEEPHRPRRSRAEPAPPS